MKHNTRTITLAAAAAVITANGNAGCTTQPVYRGRGEVDIASDRELLNRTTTTSSTPSAVDNTTKPPPR